LTASPKRSPAIGKAINPAASRTEFAAFLAAVCGVLVGLSSPLTRAADISISHDRDAHQA